MLRLKTDFYLEKMTSNAFNVSEFEAFEIESARDVVCCSFIVQRSLMPLDLNACEYTFSRRSFFTENGYKKMCQPYRRILYTLHLDMPRDLERNLTNPTPHDTEWYRTVSTSVSEWVYNRDLAPIIVNNITLSYDKTEKLRRYLNIMKLLKLHENRSTANFIFDSLIRVLYPDCMDSNLVVEFAESFSFFSWITSGESPDIVGYVMEHARRIRYNILESPQWRLDPINACIIFQRTGNIGKLQEYGTTLRFECNAYSEILSDFLGARWTTHRNISERRLYLLLQFFYFFEFNSMSWVELRSIWRSIPDPYLSAKEIYLAFGGVASFESFYAMHSYYNSIIEAENVPIEHVFPRSLQHLCRVAVRNNLSSNFQLPHGIDQIGVGTNLEKFLKLEW